MLKRDLVKTTGEGHHAYFSTLAVNEHGLAWNEHHEKPSGRSGANRTSAFLGANPRGRVADARSNGDCGTFRAARSVKTADLRVNACRSQLRLGRQVCRFLASAPTSLSCR